MKGIFAAITILLLIGGALFLVRMAMAMFSPKPVGNPFERKPPARTIESEPDRTP